MDDSFNYEYMFFVLIENNAIIEIAFYVAIVLGIVSFLLLITHFVLSGIINKKRSNHKWI